MKILESEVPLDVGQRIDRIILRLHQAYFTLGDDEEQRWMLILALINLNRLLEDLREEDENRD